MRKAILMLSAVLVLGFGVNVFAQERPGAGAYLTTNSRRELKLLWASEKQRNSLQRICAYSQMLGRSGKLPLNTRNCRVRLCNWK